MALRLETPYPNGVAFLTGHERRDANWCWRPRGTPIPLLVHTRSGRGVLRVGDSDPEHVLSAGDTALWTAGAHQDFGCPRSDQRWEIVWAHFRPRSHWHDWLEWPSPGPGVFRLTQPQPRMRARIDAALLEMDNFAHSGGPRGAEFAMNALERALLWLDAANPRPSRLDDRIHEAISFIAAHLHQPLGVAAIADAVQLSPSRLSHLFTEQIGVPPARFVERRRIERAQALLESSSRTIGSVAYEAGFSSQFYFAARFRAMTGMSPSQWRHSSLGS